MIFFLFFLVVLGTAVGEATVNKQQTSETGVEKLASKIAKIGVEILRKWAKRLYETFFPPACPPV